MTITEGRSAQGQSLRTLIVLLRRTLGRSTGIRAARFFAGLLALGVVAVVAVTSAGFGANSTSLSLVARSAAMLVWFPGAIAALSLATPPKDAALAQGIAALAMARGFDAQRLARAETMACVRLLGEIILVPIVAMGGFVLAIAARGGLAGTAIPLAGSLLFGAIAAAVLGLAASLCRTWGGERGARWLLGVIFGPWIIAEVVLPARLAPFVSIPGLLERLWNALATVPT